MNFQYSTLFNAPLSLATYALLAGAILSLWIKRDYFVWGTLFAVAAVCGIISDRLQWPALLFMMLFGGLCYFTFHASHLKLKITCGIFVYVMSIFLWYHQIPGFSNWQIVNGALLSTDALPLSLYLNFDKPLIGLFILGFGTLPLLKSKKDWSTVFIKTAPIAILGTVVIAGLAYAFGYIKFEPKWDNFFIVWFTSNLFLTAIAEEVLFRGFVQKYLSIAFKKIRFGSGLALLIASILFAVVHTGGLTYILLAFVSGILYGWVYIKTNRIEASILTHLFLNSIHILFLTYPGLASVA
ncbi:MAG TPA: CPBP family intramembrane glutamic endopeptidase [Gammaproteobacteria bacterium]|nr:CPBP family intramembrane glutamic endopeptidase [Gammaproteobacteria bacterium]